MFRLPLGVQEDSWCSRFRERWGISLFSYIEDGRNKKKKPGLLKDVDVFGFAGCIFKAKKPLVLTMTWTKINHNFSQSCEFAFLLMLTILDWKLVWNLQKRFLNCFMLLQVRKSSRLPRENTNNKTRIFLFAAFIPAVTTLNPSSPLHTSATVRGVRSGSAHIRLLVIHHTQFVRSRVRSHVSLRILRRWAPSRFARCRRTSTSPGEKPQSADQILVVPSIRGVFDLFSLVTDERSWRPHCAQ